MSDLTFILVEHGSSEYQQTLALRDDILRKPLGLVFDPNQLAKETVDFHLACFRDADLVGCLVLTPRENGELKMRQVAVKESEQGRGIGRELVSASERIARENGFTTMVLNARATVVPFYEKLGYSVVGEPFEEVTIRHRAMMRVL
ncbi:MAG: GNAT family N-acetyltransferase [bacterium]|nr:GNAT family N-acetyltransferase [Candidatus Kapabacteria bacterium]